MHAGQVLDMQADLLDRLTGSKVFFDVVSHTLGGRDDGTTYKSRPVPGSGAAMTNAVINHVQGAYAYRVTEEMSDLVMHAASVLEDEDLVDVSLPPTGCGIVRFDKPLPLIDARGKTMLIHWATWGPAKVQVEEFGGLAGLFVTTWNDLEDPDDVAKTLLDPAIYGKEKIERTMRYLGRWGICGANLMEAGQPLGSPMIPLSDAAAKRIREDGDEPQSFTNVDRYMHALWLLLGQTIVTVDEEESTGAFRKRALRKNLPARVSVIRLRRSASTSHAGESHVEWSHRWITRGHWRWQPCGTGRAERRRIWIQDHVKGPADKPLIITDKVYSLDR